MVISVSEVFGLELVGAHSGLASICFEALFFNLVIMKTFIRLLLISFLACGIVIAQNEDELQIPEEQDNQFPPENQSAAVDTIAEGSGAGIVLEQEDNTEATILPLEDIKTRVLKDNIDATTQAGGTDSCPSPCVCNTQGEEFVVDCSGYEIAAFPSHLDTRTTILNINNNKLLEIPIAVSALKNLKVLNADNNLIMELVPGSVSELPELVKLKLANNRLLEYPQDLKNAFALTKLQELDLGGNDIRSTLTAELFSNFKQLKNVTLPIATPDLLQALCRTLKDSLETVCEGNCSENFYECPDAPENIDEGLIIATTPISIVPVEEVDDPIINVDLGYNETTTSVNTKDDTTEDPQLSKSDTSTVENIPQANNKEELQISGIAPLSAIITQANESGDQISVQADDKTAVKTGDEAAVNIGATTTATAQSGGVDKSVIGLVVAGMIVIIAGITIGKNWTSIKKRFSSTPRTPERAANGTNGSAPEEVPLQDKSPV